LSEIDAPICNQTPDFIAKLGICVPNLKKFSTRLYPVSLLKDVLQSLKSLEFLTIIYHDIKNTPIYLARDPVAFQEIFQHINDYGVNLQEVIFERAGELNEMLIREKLKNLEGLMVKWTDHSIVI
jgi:hypothetical protein